MASGQDQGHVQGYADAPFDILRSLLEERIQSQEEVGASIVINIDGRNVVDLWGGYADEARTKPWEADTITNVWSSTKTIANIAALVQIDRGKLHPDEKVATYWPEFAANGKEDVLVRHIMSHTSGVSGWQEPITHAEVEDLSISVPRLAQQAPWWKPGTASGYHAVNQGHLLGELIRRTSGKSMKQFVAEDIAGYLGADFQIGALEKDWPRVANVVPPPPLPLDFSSVDADSPRVKTFMNPSLQAEQSWTPSWRRADMAAVNGHGNARSLARIGSAIALGGTVDGKKLLSPETIDLIFREQANSIDVVLGFTTRFGMGLSLTGGGTAGWLPRGRVCYWGGWGGSMILMDLDRKLTFSYVMNKMGSRILGSDSCEIYLRAAYKAMGAESCMD